MLITTDYVFFWGGVFSQWHPSSFIVDGIVYLTAEQYMMAKKALIFNDVENYNNIMDSIMPNEQKAYGRMVRGFNKEVWDRVCRKIVYDGNYAKFSQNKDMLKILLDTGNKEIVEASPEDRIWGIGLHMNDIRVHDKTKWEGTNWLGIELQRVREALHY